MSAQKANKAENSGFPPLFDQIEVLFEDAWMLALNKPAGIVVNRARSVKEPTLQDWVEQHCQNSPEWQAECAKDEVFAERTGMVHRLDKETSGVILFAKTAEAMFALMEQFQARTVQKTYLALVHGQLPTLEGIVRAPIERNPQNREKFTVTANGRPSETVFAVQRQYKSFQFDLLRQKMAERGEKPSLLERDKKLYEDGFALVELSPKTGRTHQIRVHMQFLHHPLVGDERYVGRKRYRMDEFWMPRQWLHAATIVWKHPHTGEKQLVSAPLAADLRESLQYLTQ